jgi:sarcosine oxidase
VHPDQRDFAVDDATRKRVIAHVERWMPGLDPTPHHEVTCLYTTTPDEFFVLERHGPVVVGSPCSGHGFKFAPAVGERLAALALEGGR